MLTWSCVVPSLFSQRLLPLPSLFQVWTASYGFKAQLLVDEECKDSQKDNKDPYGRQEANGFRSDWQENTSGGKKKKTCHHYYNDPTFGSHN